MKIVVDMKTPFSGLEERAYWRTGVASRHPLNLGDIYRKKFDIDHSDRIATAGSCFAQHIATRLRGRGFEVLDLEPAPAGLDAAMAGQFGFGLYSARYGNIYTIRQLLQLVNECRGLRNPVDIVWRKDGRFYDALRPTAEPGGFASAELVVRHRAQHLERVCALFHLTSLFIFTFGLTETFEHVEDGTVYPTAPGVVAGDGSTDAYRFKNLTYEENLSDFLEFRSLVKELNPDMRFLLTVSPVPLTATASGDHVLAATVYSKSVLRAVAGTLSQRYEDIDYFPSYEIISGIQARGFFYEQNLREVSDAGVSCVMERFFAEHGQPTPDGASESVQEAPAFELPGQKVYCEERLLEAFAK